MFRVLDISTRFEATEILDRVVRPQERMHLRPNSLLSCLGDVLELVYEARRVHADWRYGDVLQELGQAGRDLLAVLGDSEEVVHRLLHRGVLHHDELLQGPRDARLRYVELDPLPVHHEYEEESVCDEGDDRAHADAWKKTGDSAGQVGNSLILGNLWLFNDIDTDIVTTSASGARPKTLCACSDPAKAT